MTAKTDPAPTDAATPARAPEPGPNTVTLSRPIGTGEGAIKALTLRKPGPGELRGLQLGLLAAGDVGMLMKVIPRIAMPPVSETQVAGMELGDFTECYVVIQDFLRT